MKQCVLLPTRETRNLINSNPSIYLFIYIYIYLSINLSILLYTYYQSIQLPTLSDSSRYEYQSIYLFMYLSIDLSIYLSIYISIYLHIYLPFYIHIINLYSFLLYEVKISIYQSIYSSHVTLLMSALCSTKHCVQEIKKIYLYLSIYIHTYFLSIQFFPYDCFSYSYSRSKYISIFYNIFLSIHI